MIETIWGSILDITFLSMKMICSAYHPRLGSRRDGAPSMAALDKSHSIAENAQGESQTWETKTVRVSQGNSEKTSKRVQEMK